MGFVHVKGRPAADESVTAPMSKEECIHYETRVLVASSNSSRWNTLLVERPNDYFYLEDSTGNTLIDAEKADMQVHATTYQGEELFTQEAKKLLDKADITIRRFGNLYTPAARIEEVVLKKDNSLTIYGTADDNSHVEDASQETGHKDLMITAQANQPFIITDQTREEIMKKNQASKVLLYLGIWFFIVVSAALWLLVSGPFQRAF